MGVVIFEAGKVNVPAVAAAEGERNPAEGTLGEDILGEDSPLEADSLLGEADSLLEAAGSLLVDILPVVGSPEDHPSGCRLVVEAHLDRRAVFPSEYRGALSI